MCMTLGLFIKQQVELFKNMFVLFGAKFFKLIYLETTSNRNKNQLLQIHQNRD